MLQHCFKGALNCLFAASPLCNNGLPTESFMFEPNITELFVVEDESGNTQGIMEVTMSSFSQSASEHSGQNVSYWLADGTLVEAVAGSLLFVDRDTDAQFRRINPQESHKPYRPHSDA